MALYQTAIQFRYFEEGMPNNVSKPLNPKPYLTTPPDLAQALKEGKVLKKFETMVFTRKKKYLLWVSESKKDGRANRIQKVVEQLKWGNPL